MNSVEFAKHIVQKKRENKLGNKDAPPISFLSTHSLTHIFALVSHQRTKVVTFAFFQLFCKQKKI